MGGTGSGRPLGSTASKKAKDTAKKNRTKDTERFLLQVEKQKGDRVFRVVRRYPSGAEQILGKINSSRPEDVALKFGGGHYKLHELDKALEIETGRVLDLQLHPSVYPFKKKYSQEIFEQELERQQLAETEDSMGAGGKSEKQVYEEALAQARKEFEQQGKLDRLQAQLAEMEKRLTQPAAGPQSFAEQAALFFDLFKKMVPPPPAQPQQLPVSPMQQMKEALELVDTLKGYASKLGGGGGKDAVVFDRIIGTMSNLANKALDTHLAERRTAGNLTPSPVAGAGAAAAAGSSPASVITTEEVETMMDTVTGRILADQKAQLAERPSGTLEETAHYVRTLMNSTSAAPALVNLRNSIKIHETEELLDYIGQYQPDLVATQRHKDWLAALIDLCKK